MWIFIWDTPWYWRKSVNVLIYCKIENKCKCPMQSQPIKKRNSPCSASLARVQTKSEICALRFYTGLSVLRRWINSALSPMRWVKKTERMTGDQRRRNPWYHDCGPLCDPPLTMGSPFMFSSRPSAPSCIETGEAIIADCGVTRSGWSSIPLTLVLLP